MKKLVSIICLLLFVTFNVSGQRFPVNVIPQVNPPAPINFYNYADATTINSPLRVQLLLSDITINNRQIKLRVSFKGRGINFQSTEFVSGAAPLFIQGGTPLVLTNAELAPYFEFQNLQGINPSTYGQGIPEGNYQFCFEVFDFITGNRLSEKGCATTYIFRNDPPILNLPLNATNIEPKLVDNIVFQWTPRNINVSNVEYELSIVEIWDDTIDPQTAFLSSPPIFETTTRANAYVYGPADPQLLPDKRYAWQIRAKALQGAEEIGLFKNEGKSEVFWFSRTEPCDPPENVYAEAKGISKINVFWDEDPATYTEYVIAYRENDKPNAQWFTMRTNSGWATVWDLKPGTTYEYKVKAKCKYQYSEYSEEQLITTATAQDETANYNCGIVPDEIAINNREPYQGIQVGDRITAGDFVVTITGIESESGGRLSGTGYVSIPYLELARFGVTYKNILVNTDKQLAEGEIVTLYDSAFGDGEQLDVDLNLDLVELINGDDEEVNYVDVAFDITNIRVNQDGATVVSDANGVEHVIPGAEDAVIRDADGTAWSVSEDGEIQQGHMAEGGMVTESNTTGITDGEVVELTANGVVIDFLPSGFYSYDQALDQYPSGLSKEYETIQLSNGDEYKVAYKAISKINGEDFVKAAVTITNPDITSKDIVFKTKKGIEVDADWKGNEVTLSLKRKFDYATEEILATVVPKDKSSKYAVAGKLNLTHLGSDKTANVKVVIVPVNGANMVSRLGEKINKIYNKVGVNFDITISNAVTVPQNAWDINGNGVLDVGDSGIVSHYTDEEKAINAYVKEQINYNDNVYYIFATNLQLSETSQSGFMPLKKQYGFVFSETNQARTIAHELGHGVFGLEHPFVEYGSSQGSTDLLMDYNNGTKLTHLDWKKIHAPGLQLYLFQDDEDGASNNVLAGKKEKVEKILKYIKKRYNGVEEDFTWKTFIKAPRNGRNVPKAINLNGAYKFNLDGKELSFKLEDQPSFENLQINVVPGNEVFEIKKSTTALVFDAGVYYELVIKTDKDNFVFKFDHHDDIETFCNYLKINRETSHEAPYASNYSVKIIDYLNDEFFPEDGIFQNVDCNNIDTYFSEIPSSYLSYIHDSNFISNEKLWLAFSALLSCSVNDKGVSEEDAVITIMEALGKRAPEAFLSKLKSEKIDGDIAFRKLYSRIDNWGGGDNFTKFINVLHKAWKKTGFATNAVHDIPYQNEQTLGFYFSDYKLSFEKLETTVRFSEKATTVVAGPGTGSGDGMYTNYNYLGSYDIYDPIRLVKYQDVVSPGFAVEETAIPMFVLKAIAENASTSNTDRGVNFAFEAALTASGVGNIAKLRHLAKLGKLDDLVQALQGADAMVSSVNLMLKYSTLCDPPSGAGQQNTSSAKSFCDKLGLFGDAIGLTGGVTSLVQRAAIKRNAGDLLEEIEDNPQLINNVSDKNDIIADLKMIIGGVAPNDINLSDLKRLLQNVSDQTLLDFENVKLTLSTVEFLLKYAEGCDANETCKATKFYLDIIQKGIKARDLSVKIKTGAENFLKEIENDPNAFGDPTTKQQVIKEQEVILGKRVSSLESVLADSRYSKIKNIFDNATPGRRADLRKAWRVLEPYSAIRVANNGKNLEILANVHSRFEYGGNKSFEALKTLMAGASKQKLIDGLDQVDKLFDTKLPVKFSGIKVGDVKVIRTIDGKSEEVARIDNNGAFLKKKFLTNGTVVGNHNDVDILQTGNEIGFRKIE